MSKNNIEENIDAIFIDKNDSDKLALVLQNETDAKIYVLDSGMNGKEDLNSYISFIDYLSSSVDKMLNRAKFVGMIIE